MGCSRGKRRSYPLHARRAAAARRAGGAHGWPRVFKLARNGDETAVCRRPKAVNACLLRPHPSSYTHGSIHRKQRLHIWPQCRAHSISWHVAIASLTLLEHSGRQRADGDGIIWHPWYSKLKLLVVRTKRGSKYRHEPRRAAPPTSHIPDAPRGASGRPLQPPCTVAAVTLWLDLSKLNAACLCIWFIYINPELLVVL